MASISPILRAKSDLQGEFRRQAGNERADGTPFIEAGNKNTAPLAARFLICEQARSYWNKAYDTVKAEAREAGVLGSEEDYVEGETCVVSSFTGFDVVAKKASASEMVDRKALENALNKHVSGPKREAILAECIKERKGAVTISVSVK